jgi:hypothetical protein
MNHLFEFFFHDVFTLTPVPFPTDRLYTNIGTILGATEMVTGFPPSSLLMTSV